MSKLKTIQDLANDLGNLTIKSITYYIEVHSIKIDDKHLIGSPQWFASYQRISNELYDFFIKQKKEIAEFSNDWYERKTISQISKKTGKPVNDIIELVNSGNLIGQWKGKIRGEVNEDTILQYASSFEVKMRLDEKNEAGKQVDDLSYTKRNIEHSGHKSLPFTNGYDDIATYILEQLEPVLNPFEQSEWGLRNPGGILLYGPPGCGKTHWAEWIANFIDYKLLEVPRSTFGSRYVDGAMNNLIKILDSVEAKTAIFFDEFDSIAAERSSSSSSSVENSKVVNTLLQEIPKLINKNVIIIGATNFVNRLDSAVVRPGRFDLKLPIFPPLPSERVQLLFQTVICNADRKPLPNDSPLIKILKNLDTYNQQYWQQYGKSMLLFSNSLVIDAGISVKLKIKKLFKENNDNIEKEILDIIIQEAITDTKSKLTKKDVEFYANFYQELKESNLSIFSERQSLLHEELKEFYNGDKNAPLPIGFRIPNVEPKY